jgi:hypothetical protein
VAAYTATLTTLPPSPDSPSAAAHMATALQGVLEILTAASGPSTVCRVDCAAADTAAAEGVARSIVGAALQSRGGRIGWLPQLSSPTPAPHSAGSEATAIVDSASREEVGTGAVNEQAAGSGSTAQQSRSAADEVASLGADKKQVLAARAAKVLC